MGQLLAVIVVLVLMQINPASADSILDFSFSGPLEDNGRQTGSIATATGQLVFDQIGNNVMPEQVFIGIEGVPGYQYGVSSEVFTTWDIAPNGDILSGLFESGDGSGGVGEADFSLWDNAFGSIGTRGYFGLQTGEHSTESFRSNDVTLTQIDPSPVPEPMSLAVFATALFGLIVMKKLYQPPLMLTHERPGALPLDPAGA